MLLEAVGYLRRSDRRQMGNHSLDIQRHVIEQVAARKGYAISQWFVDDGVSAYRRRAGERHGIRSMIDHVLSHDIAAVFFYDEARLTRRITDFISDVWDEIGRTRPQTKFISASAVDDSEWDPWDPKTQIQLLFAKDESVQKSIRAIDTQYSLLEQEHRPGDRAPFGYSQDKHGLFANEDAIVVFLIFHLASWGYSSGDIAEHLSACSIPSPSEAVWSPNTVDFILDNRVYIGQDVWKSTRKVSDGDAEATHSYILSAPAIVPPVVWEMANGLRSLKKTTGRKFKSNNLVQGLVFCSACNCALVAKNETPSKSPRAYLFYKCPKCKKKVKTSAVHDIIIRRIAREFFVNRGPQFEVALEVLKTWENELTDKLARLTEYRNVITQIRGVSTIPDGVLTSCDIATEDTEQQIAKWEIVRQRTVALAEDGRLNEFFDRFRHDNFELLTPVEQRAFLNAVIDRVTVRFGDIHQIIVSYRLTPFVEIDDVLGALPNIDKS